MDISKYYKGGHFESAGGRTAERTERRPPPLNPLLIENKKSVHQALCMFFTKRLDITNYHMKSYSIWNALIAPKNVGRIYQTCFDLAKKFVSDFSASEFGIKL